MARSKVRALPHGVTIGGSPIPPPKPPPSSAKPPPELSHIVTRFKCDLSRRRPATMRRECHVCGVGFLASRAHANYCSQKCRKIISRFHQRETNIGATELFAELYPFSKIAQAWRKKVHDGR